MKIDNSSTVVANVKVNTEKAGAKSAPPVPEKDLELAKRAQQKASPQPSRASEAQEAAKARQSEIEVRQLKQDQLDQQSKQAIEEKVANAVESIRGFIQENQRALDFDVAQESNRIIISVIDRSTNEIIRQIPPEDAIQLAERIKKGDDITKSGLLLEGKV
jgi:flagellar protein FlaG